MHKLVFFGSSYYSLPVLEALAADGRYEIVGVVSQPDKPVGRKQILTPTPVSLWATEHDVALLTPHSWKKDLEAVERLRTLGAEVAVLAIYGKILPPHVLDVFLKGIVNIHPSLLPKYRGPAPAVGAILNGDAISGVAIMVLVAEMDAGPILAMEEFVMDAAETPDSYYKKGFALGADLLIKVLPEYLGGNLQLTEQDDSLATYTHMLSRDNGKIDWNLSAVAIERMVRAYTPWPGTWTEVWIDVDGKLRLEKEMAERLGLPFEDGNWDGVTRKRMKILSVVLEGEKLILDQVQIEGEIAKIFRP